MEKKLENCVVRKWDKVYCELLKQILTEGEEVENRTGINTMTAEDPMTAVAIGTGKYIECLTEKMGN